MPLYVGDYLADTIHLTCTEHGAYTLLLMTMWRAGGTLPNDPGKLCRFARCTPAQWARMSDTLMAFFDVDGDQITQGRLVREMTKHAVAVKQRRDAASNGGKAKALKNLQSAFPDARVSFCQPEPEPEPDKNTDDDSARARFSDIDRATVEGLEKRLREAGGVGVNATSPMLQVVAPILGLLRPGDGPACDLELDVIPAIMAAASKVRRPVDRWDYFVPMIREARDRRLQGAPAVGDVRSTGPPANSFMDRFEADRAEARRRVLNG